MWEQTGANLIVGGLQRIDRPAARQSPAQGPFAEKINGRIFRDALPDRQTFPRVSRGCARQGFLSRATRRRQRRQW